jgi:hypothetical protein
VSTRPAEAGSDDEKGEQEDEEAEEHLFLSVKVVAAVDRSRSLLAMPVTTLDGARK